MHKGRRNDVKVSCVCVKRWEMRRNIEVLQGDEEASKGITEALKGDQEKFEGNREALKGNGEA